MTWDEAETARQIKGVIMAPVVGGLGGAALGACLTCAVAPSGFLNGPRGRECMKVIGTKSVFVARLACAAFGVLVAAVFSGLGWLVHTRG